MSDNTELLVHKCLTFGIRVIEASLASIGAPDSETLAAGPLERNRFIVGAQHYLVHARSEALHALEFHLGLVWSREPGCHVKFLSRRLLFGMPDLDRVECGKCILSRRIIENMSQRLAPRCQPSPFEICNDSPLVTPLSNLLKRSLR